MDSRLEIYSHGDGAFIACLQSLGGHWQAEDGSTQESSSDNGDDEFDHDVKRRIEVERCRTNEAEETAARRL